MKGTLEMREVLRGHQLSVRAPSPAARHVKPCDDHKTTMLQDNKILAATCSASMADDGVSVRITKKNSDPKPSPWRRGPHAAQMLSYSHKTSVALPQHIAAVAPALHASKLGDICPAAIQLEALNILNFCSVDAPALRAKAGETLTSLLSIGVALRICKSNSIKSAPVIVAVVGAKLGSRSQHGPGSSEAPADNSGLVGGRAALSGWQHLSEPRRIMPVSHQELLNPKETTALHFGHSLVGWLRPCPRRLGPGHTTATSTMLTTSSLLQTREQTTLGWGYDMVSQQVEHIPVGYHQPLPGITQGSVEDDDECKL
ncbi:hypothetical protein EYF80_001550 [Liparis tanakae]|uniref:Uncharacterized protein n=1 Tax=Liparis tanakae TaxID=230148 RepID=A0A4Z2JET4_9TELE|nr:hypothetical protein EYF80_001550 [Liparis tanakae]